MSPEKNAQYDPDEHRDKRSGNEREEHQDNGARSLCQVIFRE